MKHLKKNSLWLDRKRKKPDRRNAREYYQSFIRKKKISKTIKNNYLSIENL